MKTAYGRRRLRTLALALGTAALLAACFGGGDDDAAPYSFETAEAPPEGTGGSTSTVLAFINDLAGSPLERREPFNIDSLTVPSDNADNQEPARTSIDQ